MTIRQLVIDATGCSGPLADAAAITAAMRGGAMKVGAQIREESCATYVPHGVTAVLILAESHVLVSTWPEHGLALVDVLLCNDRMDPHEVWATIAAVLRPSDARIREIERRIGTPEPA
jgi:S-adenosylmethionine decarboxylase